MEGVRRNPIRFTVTPDLVDIDQLSTEETIPYIRNCGMLVESAERVMTVGQRIY